MTNESLQIDIAEVLISTVTHDCYSTMRIEE